MKTKKIINFFICLLIAATAVPVLSAEEQEDRVFPVFLTGLVRKHDELKTLAMPEVEIHTAEGYENEAMYFLTFRTTDDAQVFIAALREENVPFGTFPQREKQLVLFYTDMIRFLFMDVIGL